MLDPKKKRKNVYKKMIGPMKYARFYIRKRVGRIVTPLSLELEL